MLLVVVYFNLAFVLFSVELTIQNNDTVFGICIGLLPTSGHAALAALLWSTAREVAVY